MKFRYKIFFGIILINFLISGATGSFFYFESKKALYNTIKNELIAVSRLASSLISGDSLANIKDTSYVSSEEYMQIQQLLGKIENASEDFLYAYTMRLKGSTPIFVVDSPPKDYNNDGKITEEEMPLPVGTIYKNPPNSMLMGFVKPSVDDKPIKDESDWTMSGYSPINNSKGEPVGLIGVDMSVTQIKKKLSTIQKAGLISLVIVIVLSMGLSLYFTKKFIQPLKVLQFHFNNITMGDFTKIDVKRQDEIGELFKNFNFMAEQLREKELLKSFMGKLIDKNIAEQLIKNQLTLNGEIVNAVILFCDLKNFSELSSKISPKFTLYILNEYFEEMVKIISEHRGYVDKFIGDGIMAIFRQLTNDMNPFNLATKAAIQMNDKCNKLNEKLGLKDFFLENYIGIHYGTVVSGLIGSKERIEYTIIGDAVNIAERLERLNKSFNSKITISEDIFNNLTASLQKKFKLRGPQHLKGIKYPITVYSM